MTNEPATDPASGPRRADITGERIAAGLIDVALLGVLLLVMSAVFGQSSTDSGSGGVHFEANLSGAPFLLYLLLVYGYYFACEALTGRTLGKRLLGLRVIAQDGSLTWGKVAIRTALRVVDGLPVLYLVGLVAVIASKQHQRLGDMAAGTLVVKG